MADIDPIAPPQRIDLARERAFELGGLTVRPSDLLVLKHGERRELQPRVMQVLVALAKARPEVVSRDRLIEQCWNGRIVGDDALNRCVLALRHLAQELTPAPFTIETVPRVGHRLVEKRSAAAGAEPFHQRARRTKWSVFAIIGALAALVVVGLLLLRPWQIEPRVPSVLVAASGNDGVSRQFARDLATQIGNLQTSQAASMRLLSDAAGLSDGPDLVLNVSRTSEPGTLGATAVLTDAPSRTILWSNDFQQPSRNLPDLRQQVAYTVAHVLRCASEGLASEDPLAHETLKTYLNACAAMSDAAAYDARPVVRALETVVTSAPGFIGGWAKFLQAETEALASPVLLAGPGAAPALKRHILAARRLKRDMPETYLAEYYLTRPLDFVGRRRLLDEAVERSPNHAGVRSTRALFFTSVGAMDDAVREAREAVRLDPLSPGLRVGLVGALAGAGNTNEALAEVAELRRLWPEASGANEASYIVHLRYGDPREALRLIESRAIDMPIAPLHRTFLEARIDPSPPNVDKAVRQAESVYRDYPQSMYNYAQTLAEFDRKEELLHVLLNPSDLKEFALSTEVLFRPFFSELHKDPRFIRALKPTGVLQYWRITSNWPDFCYATDLPYDCKVEVAKVAT